MLGNRTFSTMSVMLWEWSSTNETGKVVPQSSSTSRVNWMAASESPPSWLKLELPSPSSVVSMPNVRAAACSCKHASVPSRWGCSLWRARIHRPLAQYPKHKGSPRARQSLIHKNRIEDDQHLG